MPRGDAARELSGPVQFGDRARTSLDVVPQCPTSQHSLKSSMNSSGFSMSLRTLLRKMAGPMLSQG